MELVDTHFLNSLYFVTISQNDNAATEAPVPPVATDSTSAAPSIPVRPGLTSQISNPVLPSNSLGGPIVGNAPNHPIARMVSRHGHVSTPLPYMGFSHSTMVELPALRDAPPNKREELFIKKLQLCGMIFSFDDPTSDKRGKDMRRQTILELVDYVNTPAGQKIFTESVMADLMQCVSFNVCRALPPVTDDFDPEEDEPELEPAWPHL